MKKKKISKEDIEKVNKKILEIRKAQKERENLFIGRLNQQKERTKKVESGVSKAFQVKRNTLRQTDKNINRLIESKYKKGETVEDRGKKFDALIRKRRLLERGIESAKENLKKQRVSERKQAFKTKALILGSKIEAGVEKTLAGSLSKLGQLAKKQITSRKILKKSKTSYKMPNRQVQNIFEDENRFFRGAVKNGFI